MASNIGGYDCDFVEPPPDSLLCLICTFVAREPMQMDCCGKVYCKACLEELKKRTNQCPNCREKGNGFKDRKSEREIKALKVKCDNLKNGCRWVGELASLDEHHDTCDLALLPCPNECIIDDKVAQLLRKDIETHCENKCPNRSYQCPHCREEGKHCDITTSHLKTCPQLVVPCPNKGCNERLPRCKIPDHRTKCPFEKVGCRYSKIGCEDQPLRKELANHENNDQLHLHIAMETILKRETRLNKLETESKEHARQMQTHLSQLKTEKKEHTSQMQTRLNKLETESKGHAIKIQTRLNKLETDSKERSSQMQTCFNKLKTESKAQASKVQSRFDKFDDKIEQVSTTASSQFVCKVSEFSQRKSTEEEFYSPPFYTHQGGYKMCLGVDPNGWGDGKGTHVSVFPYLMRGENDDTLTWPFTGTITVELLNQLEDKEHHRLTIPYPEGEEDVSNRRVVDRERATGGQGISKFILHLALGHRPATNCQYLKDDCLYFRVSVKAAPNPKPWLTCTV